MSPLPSCPTCGVFDPDDNLACSNAFHHIVREAVAGRPVGDDRPPTCSTCLDNGQVSATPGRPEDGPEPCPDCTATCPSCHITFDCEHRPAAGPVGDDDQATPAENVTVPRMTLEVLRSLAAAEHAECGGYVGEAALRVVDAALASTGSGPADPPTRPHGRMWVCYADYTGMTHLGVCTLSEPHNSDRCGWWVPALPDEADAAGRASGTPAEPPPPTAGEVLAPDPCEENCSCSGWSPLAGCPKRWATEPDLARRPDADRIEVLVNHGWRKVDAATVWPDARREWRLVPAENPGDAATDEEKGS